eukprot:2145932-Ditylum_brightwellii.AAC.1
MKYSPLTKTTLKIKTISWALQDNSGRMSSSEENSELIGSSYVTMTNGRGTNKNASSSKPGVKKPVDVRNAL